VRLLVRNFGVAGVAISSAIAVLFAAIPIVAVGLAFFPAQFPRDSDYGQTLLWLGTVTLGMCSLAALLGAICALISTHRVSRRP
jgi:hypothetical protein